VLAERLERKISSLSLIFGKSGFMMFFKERKKKYCGTYLLLCIERCYIVCRVIFFLTKKKKKKGIKNQKVAGKERLI
jgi:hypothetical protein